MSDEKTNAEPSGASGGSLANYQAILDSCLRGSTVEQRFCEPPVAGSTPAAGLCVQWIPVSERLPPGGVRVLIWCGPGTFVDFATLDWKYGWHYDDYGSPEPTHWMPLPAPPTDAK